MKSIMKKQILDKKWAKISLEVAREWWRENHQRTDIKLGVFGQDGLSKDKYGGNGREEKRVIQDEKAFIHDEMVTLFSLMLRRKNMTITKKMPLKFQASGILMFTDMVYLLLFIKADLVWLLKPILSQYRG